MKKLKALAASVVMSTAALSGQAMAQDCFIGEIALFGGNFAPRGWAPAEGQLLAVSGNEALFSILGTTYGGDGRTTFGLPDLRGRVAVGAGTGPGLPTIRLGERGGQGEYTLTNATMPNHSHAATTTTTLRASSTDGINNVPTGKVLANDGRDRIYSATSAPVAMGGDAISSTTTVDAATGNQTPVTNRQPTTGMRYIICLQGLFPSRN